MLSLQPLFELFGKTDDFLVQRYELHGQLLQLVKQGEGFLFGQLPAMDRLDNLVVVHPDAAVLALQVGELDVVVRGRLVDFHHFHRLVENGRQDELRLGSGTGILIEPLELDVLELVQTESVVIGMELGGFLRTAASSSCPGGGRFLFLVRLFDLSHIIDVFTGGKVNDNSNICLISEGDYS